MTVVKMQHYLNILLFKKCCNKDTTFIFDIAADQYEVNFFKKYFDQVNVLYNEESIHPLKRKDQNHINFKEILKKSIAKVKDIKKFKIKIFNSILIGAPGGAAAECLQTTGKVFHITINEFDVFSGKIWKNIKIKKFSQYMYEYTLIKKMNFIINKLSENKVYNNTTIIFKSDHGKPVGYHENEYSNKGINNNIFGDLEDIMLFI